MSNKLKVLLYPNKILKQQALPIDEITSDIITLGENMLEIMYKEQGIGLAANQVGILKRLIVVDTFTDGISDPLIMINPEITSHSNVKIDSDEGCLSIPNPTAVIKRYETLDVKYLDVTGKEQHIHADGLLSCCLQHEIDHLNGKLFIDHLSTIKRNLLLSKFQKSKS